MKRVLLALWLAVFMLQAGDVLMALVPDECVQESRSAVPDECGDHCARCVCCARALPALAARSAAMTTNTDVDVVTVAADDRRSSPHPHRILHVPKHS